MSVQRNKPISVERVRELLSYCDDTGVFVWKKSPCYADKTGDVAGHVNKKGYIEIQIDGSRYNAHKLAWLYVYGVLPAEVDHANGIKSDNRIANLRVCTFNQNQHNKGLQKNNTSGVKGVNWEAQTGKWRAGLAVNKKHKTIGRFSSLDEAAAAIRAAREKYHGEFANHG